MPAVRRMHWIVSASAAMLLGACASRAGPAAAPGPGVVATSGAELPPGAGRAILDTECTSCHGLNEVTKFRGYYNRAQWRDIVVTMVEYGAAVKETEVEVLADYLTEHLGRK